MYSGDAAEQEPYMSRAASEHPPAHGRGHQNMDIDSAAAHRIPRGRLLWAANTVA